MVALGEDMSLHDKQFIAWRLNRGGAVSIGGAILRKEENKDYKSVEPEDLVLFLTSDGPLQLYQIKTVVKTNAGLVGYMNYYGDMLHPNACIPVTQIIV